MHVQFSSSDGYYYILLFGKQIIRIPEVTRFYLPIYYRMSIISVKRNFRITLSWYYGWRLDTKIIHTCIWFYFQFCARRTIWFDKRYWISSFYLFGSNFVMEMEMKLMAHHISKSSMQNVEKSKLHAVCQQVILTR